MAIPTPEQVAAFDEAIKAGNAIVCYAKCEPCQYGSHYDPPKVHGWAGTEDIDHARATGQPEPTGRCGCRCAMSTGEG